MRILSETVGTLPIHLYHKTSSGREQAKGHPCAGPTNAGSKKKNAHRSERITICNGQMLRARAVPVRGCSRTSSRSFDSLDTACGAFLLSSFRSFFASSVNTMVYISVLANHPAEEVLGALALIHPVHLASLVIGNTLTDFSIQGRSVDKSIVFHNWDKAVAAVRS